MIDKLLEIGPHVTALPVVHGSGDFAWEVRRLMMKHSYDCLAVALPPSFQSATEQAILQLPTPSIVVQRDLQYLTPTDFSPTDEFSEDQDEANFDQPEDESALGVSYVPVDPCQGVIAAIRTAMGDRIPRHFIDMETSRFEPHSRLMPDAFALKKLSLEKYAAAVLPFIEPGEGAQWKARMKHIAWQLRELSVDYKKVLFVTSVLDWPWIRAAFNDKEMVCPDSEPTQETERYQVTADTLYFLLGELPFITNLYERAREELLDDEHL